MAGRNYDGGVSAGESRETKPYMKLRIEDDERDDVNYHPIEEVRLTVSPTDDPTEPCLTFRTWVLGILSCATLAFLNEFFTYRTNSLNLTLATAQILTLPLGRLMARVLPTREFRVPFTKYDSFSLNPGPFSIKEHVLITIFASCGASGVYAVAIVTIVKTFYHRKLNLLAAWLLTQTTQLLGYGWAGLFRGILVDSPYMWWPDSMVTVSLFRALHEKDKRPRGGVSKLQFFIVVFASSFAYYVFPSYFFPTLSSISILCLIWKNSIVMQQMGSGMFGLGIGSFALDWSTVTAFLGNPIATPAFAIINILFGYFLVMYVMTPLIYYFNVFDARKFPIFSWQTFDNTGQPYNIDRVLNKETFDLDINGYQSYSKLYLSAFFAFAYGLSFASLTATITHVALYHGKTIWSLWMKEKSTLETKKTDVHTRLMKTNYSAVPNWWFYSILIIVFVLSLIACEGFGKQLQLPWWGLILACSMAFFFTLPIGIINATTNNRVGLNVITEMAIGFLYPGKPLANVTFKTYGFISMNQALDFLSDFKLGHYMKIPPKSMFIVQLAATIISSSVHFGTAWWLLSTVKGICNPDLLPEGSPWTCPHHQVFYNASIIWGVIGPLRMFTNQGVYGAMNWWFLVGAVAPIPIYFLAVKYPEKKWIQFINVPLIFSATAIMPAARSVHFIMWGILGIFFNVYIFKVYKKWWARHAYVLGAALNAGVAFMGVILFFSLQSHNVAGPNWWGFQSGDHCPLATCPMAPGVVVDGCPVH